LTGPEKFGLLTMFVTRKSRLKGAVTSSTGAFLFSEIMSATDGPVAIRRSPLLLLTPHM
jgi:hypothetical protein